MSGGRIPGPAGLAPPLLEMHSSATNDEPVTPRTHSLSLMIDRIPRLAIQLAQQQVWVIAARVTSFHSLYLSGIVVQKSEHKGSTDTGIERILEAFRRECD